MGLFYKLRENSIERLQVHFKCGRSFLKKNDKSLLRRRSSTCPTSTFKRGSPWFPALPLAFTDFGCNVDRRQTIKTKQPTLHPTRSSRRSPKTFLTFLSEPPLAKKAQLYLANLSLFGMGSLIKWRSECDEDNVGDIADYSELVDLVGAVELDTVGGRGNLQTLPGCTLCS